jgi:hypothetical protein
MLDLGFVTLDGLVIDGCMHTKRTLIYLLTGASRLYIYDVSLFEVRSTKRFTWEILPGVSGSDPHPEQSAH